MGTYNLDADGDSRCHSQETQQDRKPSANWKMGLRKGRPSAESDATFLITDSELFAKWLPRCFGQSVFRGSQQMGLLNKISVTDTQFVSS